MRLSCFTHSLQLTIGDGLKEAKISQVITKCTQISKSLHNSTKLKESFENAFGNRASVPTSNATRWNSTFRQVLSIIKLGRDNINKVLDMDHKNLMLTGKEWEQLTELVTILGPFAQATDETQGDKVVTISMVAPSIISLHNHCVIRNTSGRYLTKLSAALRDSLARRFEGGS